MGLRIGDVYLRLLAEDAGFRADAAKKAGEAGDAAAQTLGQRIASGLRTEGVRVLGTVSTAAFALMTKGALEVADAQAKIQSETNASAEEAKRMALTANRVAGDVVGDFDDIRDAAIGIRNDLGAVGDEADELTQDFGEFSRVTRQDATAAVKDFDDIIDAWNLKAGDSRTIMDALITSHKTYGGVVAEDQANLAKLAPAIQAVNGDWRDGVAMLNLAKASGLDANVAITGLTKALGEVESPEEFQRLVDDISATEDPFLRAQKAAELFGTRAGPKLADALAGNNLDDFRQELEETEGATTAANDALNSSPLEWFKQKLSQGQAALRNFGGEFGPILTSLAAMTSLMGSLGLGSALKGIWTKAAGSAAVSAVVKVAADKAATVYLQGLIASDAVGKALSGMWSKVPGNARVSSAASSAGKALGLTVGSAFSVAFAAVAVLGVIETAKRIEEETAAQQASIAASIMEQVAQANLEGLKQSKAALEQGIADLQNNLALTIFDIPGTWQESQIAELQAQLDAVNAALAAAGTEMPKAISTGIMHDNGSVPAALAETVGGAIDMSAGLMIGAATKAGEKIPPAYANGILEKQAAPLDALEQLKDLMANVLSRPKEIARLMGQLTSKALADGLNHKRPAVREEAQRVQADAEERLALLISRGGKVGKDAMDELKQGLNSKNPQVRASAQRVKEIVARELDKTKGEAGDAGAEAGSTYLKRLQSAVRGATITAYFNTSYRSDGRGGVERRARGGPIRAGHLYTVNEDTPETEFFMADTDGQILTHQQGMELVGAGAPAGGDTYNIPVNVQGALPVRTARDIVTELRRGAELGMLPARDLPPKYHRRELRTA